MKFKSNCTVKNSKLIIDDKGGLHSFIKKNEKRELCITISRKKKQRTIDQNAYYWGVVVEMIRIELGYEKYEKDQLHYDLCAKFLPSNRGVLKSFRTTSQLDTIEFNWYLEEVIRWASKFLNICIPPPKRG